MTDETPEPGVGVGTRTEARRRGRPPKAESAGLSKAERQEWIKSVNVALIDEPGLPAVPPLPGMENRWIRVRAGGQLDTANLVRAETRGWRPRQAQSVDKVYQSLRLREGEYAGCVGLNDVILMHRPLEIAKQVREIEEQKVREKDLAVRSMQFRETEGHESPYFKHENPELRAKVITGSRKVEIPD